MGLSNNKNGIAPIFAVFALVAIITGVGATFIAVDQLTERPDITYNVIESPFSFFGNQIDWIWIILIGVVIVFLLIWAFARSRRKEPETRFLRVFPPSNGN